MKQITLIIAAILLSVGLRANNEHSGQFFSQLMKLMPKVTQNDAKAMFGTATYITINNQKGEEIWQYKTDDNTLLFRWDTKREELKDVEYINRNVQEKAWSNKYLAALEMGKSSYKDVIEALGEPENMQFHADHQKLRYHYKDNMLELQFRNGVLTTCRIDNNSRK